jgi:UDP-glucose:(heptosyl)LPS alpha-1,3-glucosyltransferase
LKIALVILHADPARGGAERYTFDLAQALAGAGHEVALVASTFGPKPVGVNCVDVGERGLTRLMKYRNFLTAVDFHVDGHLSGYDVIHAMLPVRRCDVYHPHAGLAVEAVESGHLKHASLLKRSLANAANQLNRKRNAFAWVERELLKERRVDAFSGVQSSPVVLCLSDYVKQTVRRHYPTLPEDRLATLFNAVDLKKYDPAAHPNARFTIRQKYNINDDQVVALMIAQDFERKGLKETIAALAQVAAPKPTLLVVGKPDPARYRQQAKDAGLSNHVIFAGPTTDPQSFYAASDFFILPTRHDPCSLVVLEALAMGLPVISTKQNGACEIMTQSQHGFILENADDHNALVRAITILCDPKTRERMQHACNELRPRLAYEAHLEKLLVIYKQTAQLA